MQLIELSISNYKSFRGVTNLAFGPGMTIIAGQNSSGKTALLEAMQIRIPAKPHRSEATVEVPGRQTDRTSAAEARVELTNAELVALLGIDEVWKLPAPRHPSAFADSIGYSALNHDGAAVLVAFFTSQEKFTFSIKHQSSAHQGERWTHARFPSFGMYEAQNQLNETQGFLTFSLDSNGNVQRPGTVAGDAYGEIGLQIAPRLASQIYRFGAERFVAARSPFGPEHELLPDASNLAEVLSSLQGDTSLFAEFNELVHRVLPQVQSVSVDNTRDGFEIRIWPAGQGAPRRDLTHPLSECGSGVGQILAILCVVVKSRGRRVVMIDEPQSFLHPGAVRKLIEILRTNSKHQYIISTHSPSVISAAQPDRMLITRLDGTETRVDQIESRDRKHITFCLAELGARLSDVFGADEILWVEGRTEEICFTEILRSRNRALLGTSIVGVRKVGDFESGDDKHAERVFDVYTDLSKKGALIPPAVGFLFDREDRSEASRNDLIRKGKGLVRFLRRYTYENYLLVPECIADVINQLDQGRPEPITTAQVQECLDRLRGEKAFYGKGVEPGQGWLEDIHGSGNSGILERVFSDITETRVQFRKPEHSRMLTDWLLERQPAVFDEIAELLIEFLDHKVKGSHEASDGAAAKATT